MCSGFLACRKMQRFDRVIKTVFLHSSLFYHKPRWMNEIIHSFIYSFNAVYGKTVNNEEKMFLSRDRNVEFLLHVKNLEHIDITILYSKFSNPNSTVITDCANTALC